MKNTSLLTFNGVEHNSKFKGRRRKARGGEERRRARHLRSKETHQISKCQSKKKRRWRGPKKKAEKKVAEAMKAAEEKAAILL